MPLVFWVVAISAASGAVFGAAAAFFVCGALLWPLILESLKWR